MCVFGGKTGSAACLCVWWGGSLDDRLGETDGMEGRRGGGSTMNCHVD